MIRTLLSLLVFAPLMATADPGQHFNRAIHVIFENTDYSDALNQPFMGRLATEGALFSNLVALVHPSQANYIALTSGSLNGVRGDGVQDVNARNIVDLLEQKGLTWKVYAEGWPGNCYKGGSKGHYARKHNPFISYLNIQKNPQRCAQIVEATQFDVDAKSGALPDYIFYVPDIKNDGHDTGVAYADHWYSGRFASYIADAQFMKDTILVTTFDEDSGSAPNQIYTSIYGPGVKAGTYSTALNTYSLLRMIEDNWNLGYLTNEDAGATPVPNIWK